MCGKYSYLQRPFYNIVKRKKKEKNVVKVCAVRHVDNASALASDAILNSFFGRALRSTLCDVAHTPSGLHWKAIFDTFRLTAITLLTPVNKVK